jgi:hypothetical protein
LCLSGLVFLRISADIGSFADIDGHGSNPALFHRLDGFGILDQPFMGEQWRAIPRHIDFDNEHAWSQLTDGNVFERAVRCHVLNVFPGVEA